MIVDLAQALALRSGDCIPYQRLGARRPSLESRIKHAFYRRGRQYLHSKALAGRSVDFQTCVDSQPAVIITSSMQSRNIWDQCRRVVRTEETSKENGDWFSKLGLSKTGRAEFAAISARTHRPPPFPKTQRSPLPRYITVGVICTITAWIFWRVSKTESYARDQLISREKPILSARPPSEMATAYDRARASVAQAACVSRAVAAVRNNNSMQCMVEMELALEENRLARTSIESDFFEEDELLQVYEAVLKIWLDGYPLDYGKVLQLRSVLDIPGQKAEVLEQEVQQQSDAYVI